tara:strand:+ start:989 stop:1717 length:729 start_codon:yes stop_codon:yes gene_type:complete
MKPLFIILHLIFICSITNASTLPLDSLKLDKIEDDIFFKNYLDTLTIQNIITSDPRLEYYDSTLFDFTNTYNFDNYKFYNPITEEYKLYFSTFFGHTKLYDVDKSGYNYGFHLTLPFTIKFINKKFIVGSKISTSIIHGENSPNYNIQSIDLTATSRVWRNFFMKFDIGLKTIHFNANSNVSPSIGSNIYYELNLEKYSPMVLIFSNGINVAFNNPSNEKDFLIVNNLNIFFCKKFIAPKNN